MGGSMDESKEIPSAHGARLGIHQGAIHVFPGESNTFPGESNTSIGATPDGRPTFTRPAKEDNVFVGYCANEDQARRGWEALGSPGEFETYSKALQRLEANQFIFRDGKNERIEVVIVDAEQLARLAGRRSLGGAS